MPKLKIHTTLKELKECFLNNQGTTVQKFTIEDIVVDDEEIESCHAEFKQPCGCKKCIDKMLRMTEV